MKTLVAYYSRTGVTRTVAQALAERLGADVEELHDRKDRRGARGWLSGGKDALLKRLTEIDPPAKDAAAYDLVLIGTPVWAFTMTPAVRTYLSQCGAAIQSAGFFCTMGSSGDRKTFAHMARLLGRQPVSTLALLEKDVRSGDFVGPVDSFIGRVRDGG
jgi:flavodoxin